MRRVLLVLATLVLAGCTSSEEPNLDKDNDIIEDADETDGVVITIELLAGPEQRLVTSDPTVPDTDGDGLLDGDEILVRGTDPRDVDTDDDGLLDGEDIATASAPAAEWRQQGILEIEGLFLGELDACPGTDQTLRSHIASSDLPIRDELVDGEELRGWDISVRGQARHVTSDPCKTDTDADGLLDHDEKRLATDPRAADTDHDGVNDGIDADPLWDLAIQFDDANVTGSNASSVRIEITAGARTLELRWPGDASALLEVVDQTGDRDHLLVNAIIGAEDTDGQSLALFPDPRGAILSFDLVQRTAAGATIEGDRLVFAGDDGALSLRWAVLRR